MRSDRRPNILGLPAGRPVVLHSALLTHRRFIRLGERSRGCAVRPIDTGDQGPMSEHRNVLDSDISALKGSFFHDIPLATSPMR